jgi:hypothetical protein
MKNRTRVWRNLYNTASGLLLLLLKLLLLFSFHNMYSSMEPCTLKYLHGPITMSITTNTHNTKEK